VLTTAQKYSRAETTAYHLAQIGTAVAHPGSLAAIQHNAQTYPSVAAFLAAQAQLIGVSVTQLEHGLASLAGFQARSVHGLARAFAKTQTSGNLGVGKDNPGPNGTFYSGDSYGGGDYSGGGSIGMDMGGGEGSV
jgi:hypothetical protein